MDSTDKHDALIQRARTGDREAFDELVRGHLPRIAAVLRHWRGALSDQDIDDVLQEAFLRAFRGMDGFDPETHGDTDAFFRWLSGIALNVARENAKREGRRRCEPMDEEQPESAVTQSRAMRRDERMDRLQSALESLPPDYREVVRLVRLEGVPVKDVAQQLNRTPNAISRMLLRASRKLREVFGDTESLKLPARRLNLDKQGSGDGQR